MAKAFSLKEINEGVITDSSIREKLAAHIEVLDRAGKLLTMPKVNMATTEQVAEFFKVPYQTINSLADRNKDELKPDGVKRFSLQDLKIAGCDVQNVGLPGRVGVMEKTENTSPFPIVVSASSPSAPFSASPCSSPAARWPRLFVPLSST